MNWADWTIIGILAISSLISIKRGFVKEALSLAIWVAAAVIAIMFRNQLGALLVDLIDTPSLRPTAAGAMLFIGTLLVGGLVSYLIGELIKITGLSSTDRLLGMLFGLARGAIIVMVILLFAPKIIPIDQDPWWQQSRLIPEFLSFEDWSRATASDLYERVLHVFNQL
jgi:membrane protein required for colicin V production